MSEQNLDKAYSPSQWVTRFPTAEELLEYFTKLGQKGNLNL
jgi:hypothetical protein